MNELIKLLGMNSTNIEGEYIVIKSCVEFEPHGRASETWEIIWKLELPKIKYHWKSTKGWQIGTTDKCIDFNSRTFDGVVHQALEFVKWYVENKGVKQNV